MTIRSQSAIEGLKRVGAIVSFMLESMLERIEPGMTTADLDAIGAQLLKEGGARSAPELVYGFPGGDGWALAGAVGNLSAQYEHTPIVTRSAPIIVTAY